MPGSSLAQLARSFWLRTALVLAVAMTSAACAAGTRQDSGPPLRLNMPRSAIPAPGLCRVWVDGQPLSRQQMSRGCEGIDHQAPLGAKILYRPEDGSREVYVRYMSTVTRGHVTKIDAFSIDTLRLTRVVLAYQGERSEELPETP